MSKDSGKKTNALKKAPPGPEPADVDQTTPKGLALGLLERVQAYFWGPTDIPLAQVPYGRRLVRGVLLIIRFSGNKKLGMDAAALAFLTMLSLIPFLSLVFTLINLLQLPEVIRPFLLGFVAGGNPELMAQITAYLDKARPALLGTLGTGILLVLGFIMLERVKATLNDIWGVRKRHSFAKRFLEYVVVLSLTPVLLGLSFTASTFLGIRLEEVMQEWMPVNLSWVKVVEGTAYPIFWLLTFYAYAFLPETKIRWGSALRGALVGGTLLKLAQNLYISIIVKVTAYDVIYGALALIPFLMLWLYLAWWLFLLGAHITYIHQHYPLLVRGWKSRNGQNSQARDALLLLGVMLRAYQRRKKPVRLRLMLNILGAPWEVIRPVLEGLIDNRLLYQSGEKFTPAEGLGKKTLEEALEQAGLLPRLVDARLFSPRLQGVMLHQTLRRGDEALRAPLREYTLSDLAQEVDRELELRNKEEAQGRMGSWSRLKALFLKKRSAPASVPKTKSKSPS